YQEPESVQKYHRGVPRDLDAVVLRCLEKDLTRRYATARELTDELARFLRGEPVVARPVGRLERGWRWGQRNRLLAILLLSLIVAVISGVAVSVGFALHAAHERDKALESARQASAAEERAIRK